MNKKKLGVIGGMGSRSGVRFFKKLIDYSPADSDQEFLEVIFHNNSQVPDRTKAIIYGEVSPVNSLLNSIHLFNENNIEVIAITCITAYYYYQEMAEYSMAHILNPLCILSDTIRNDFSRIKRIGLLATTGTIGTCLFQKALNKCKVDIVTLNSYDQEELFMKSVYMKNGFKSSTISEEAYNLMDQSINKLVDRNVDLLIGGCTEVSTALEGMNVHIPYLDTLDLLARHTVEYCYSL